MRIRSLLVVALVASQFAGCGGSDADPAGADAGPTNMGSTNDQSPVSSGPSASGGGMRGDNEAGAPNSSASNGPRDAGSASAGGANGGVDSGAPDAGSASGSGAGDAGMSSAAGCTRDLLKTTVDAYFKALAAHDPATLPLAADVKFTENGKLSKLGEVGLWKSAGALKHVHSALDTELCQAASQAVVPDGSTDIPVALRLKLQNQKLTEVEMIAVRAGDYTVSGSPFASNTMALAASAESVKWEEPVMAAQRNSRAEITGWIEKYFRMFPRGVCNTAQSCKRIENGGGSFNCSFGASCAMGAPAASDNALKPRLLLADVETGVGVGFTMFMGNTDMHMYKMYGGQIYEVSAILGKAASSGWE